MRDYNFFEAYQKKRNLSIDVKSPVFLGIIVIILILAVSVASVLQNVILAARLASTSIELSSIQASEEYQKAIKLQDSITAMTGYDQNAEAALQKINEGRCAWHQIFDKAGKCSSVHFQYTKCELEQNDRYNKY